VIGSCSGANNIFSLRQHGCPKISYCNASKSFEYSDLRFDITLTSIKPYSAILVFTSSALLNTEALGNALADYVDQGFGGVVIMCYGNCSGNFLNSWPQGRWLTEKYNPIMFNESPKQSNPASIGAVHQPRHPVMNGVSSLSSDRYGTLGPAICERSEGVDGFYGCTTVLIL